MTNRDIDQLTGAFAYAIAALDAQAADKNISLALCNKANQCWDELLAERAARLAEVERLQAALAQEQREHANCEQFHHDGSMAKNAAMAALMDAYVEMAQEGDFDAASDEMRARVRDLLNRSKPE